MSTSEWRIYIGKIPYSKKGNYWVSFESDPGLTKTNANIYGRCLPCIQNLYEQLRKGCTRIRLGNAYNCWKITAILKGIDECLALLSEFEKKFPGKHVYGKFGSGRPGSETKVVVFHSESKAERNRIQQALKECLPKIDRNGTIQISRACSVLFDDILGDWQHWLPISPIKYPRKVKKQLEKIQKILYRSVM